MIQPLLENILAEPIEEKVSSGGIIIPDTEKKRETGKAKVLAVGQGIRTMDGKILPLLVKKGDTILFSVCAPITIDQKNYLIIREDAVIAIIKDKDNGK